MKKFITVAAVFVFIVILASIATTASAQEIHTKTCWDNTYFQHGWGVYHSFEVGGGQVFIYQDGQYEYYRYYYWNAYVEKWEWFEYRRLTACEGDTNFPFTSDQCEVNIVKRAWTESFRFHNIEADSGSDVIPIPGGFIHIDWWVVRLEHGKVVIHYRVREKTTDCSAELIFATFTFVGVQNGPAGLPVHIGDTNPLYQCALSSDGNRPDIGLSRPLNGVLDQNGRCWMATADPNDGHLTPNVWLPPSGAQMRIALPNGHNVWFWATPGNGNEAYLVRLTSPPTVVRADLALGTESPVPSTYN